MKKLFVFAFLVSLFSFSFAQEWSIKRDLNHYNFFYDTKDYVVVNINDESTFDIIFKDTSFVTYSCNCVMVQIVLIDEWGNAYENNNFVWYYDPFACCHLIMENENGEIAFIWGCLKSLKGKALFRWKNKNGDVIYTTTVNCVQNQF